MQASALNTPTTPEVFYSGQWYPICYEYFAEDHIGASTLCKQLGFKKGTVDTTRDPFSNLFSNMFKQHMRVGGCEAGEPLTACTAGGNNWGVTSPNFSEVEVTVSCKGGSNQRTISASASCGTGLSNECALCECNP